MCFEVAKYVQHLQRYTHVRIADEELLTECGGFLQWDERDLSATILGADKTGAMQALVDSMRNLRREKRGPNYEYVL